MPFDFQKAAIPDVVVARLKHLEDARGSFMETYQAEEFATAGIGHAFVQENQSGSRRGVLRGLHYQIRQAQGKLVRVLVGEVFDVAVDLRRSSSTFGRWVGLRMSAKEPQHLWIPPGFAHGFYVLSEWAEVLYRATDYYAPEWERTLCWDDPAIGIEWPILAGEPLLSEKDAHGATLAEAEAFD